MKIHMKSAQLTLFGCNSDLSIVDSVFTSGWGIR